jgi:exosortase H (IPTLxxWG-CTERM-specific)
MIRFFFLFLLIQGVLFAAELTPPGQEYVVVPFTSAIASVSATIVQAFDDRVVAYGKILQNIDNGFAVSIEAGCNGIEATIVLIAAILAFRAPWKYRLVGLGVGFATIQVMNLLRIITLFYIGQWDKTIFDWAHLYIWQALIMLDALVVFVLWLRFMPDNREPKANAAVA